MVDVIRATSTIIMGIITLEAGMFTTDSSAIERSSIIESTVEATVAQNLTQEILGMGEALPTIGKIIFVPATDIILNLPVKEAIAELQAINGVDLFKHLTFLTMILNQLLSQR